MTPRDDVDANMARRARRGEKNWFPSPKKKLYAFKKNIQINSAAQIVRHLSIRLDSTLNYSAQTQHTKKGDQAASSLTAENIILKIASFFQYVQSVY